MNVELYNRLSETLVFLEKTEYYDEQIKKWQSEPRKNDLRIMMLEGYDPRTGTRSGNHITDPNYKPTSPYDKKRITPFAILFAIFVPFIGIPYIIISLNTKKKPKSVKKQFDTANLPEDKKRELAELKEQRRQDWIKARAVLERLEAEKTNYYNSNYRHCLEYLPKETRNKMDIKTLLYLVKGGEINSVNDIRIWYAKNMRELEEEKREAELQEDQKRRHAETMAALKKISDNQELTNRELETMREIRRNHW